MLVRERSSFVGEGERRVSQNAPVALVAKWGIGSTWQRWDPHIHAPGTLRNNQFGQDWDGYLRKLEGADPAPAALGITDYFCLRTYKEVRRRMAAGALKRVALVFANVELRLTIETKDRQGINLHLLVSPDDPEHVEKMEEQLGKLGFPFRGERVPCTEEALRRLGRAYSGNTSLPDQSALEQGANQFKIELSDLRAIFDESSWVRANVLVAVAAGDDGLSGISRDSTFGASREELGRFAHIVFSGNSQDRKYWLGDHPDFEANGQTPKPCLHGSDAHSLATVLEPQQLRRCWIRGAATFDGLRQTLVEPRRRVHIGEVPPSSPSPSDTMRCLRLRHASWVGTEELAFNEGLVTVIGAKGSGKTALAELVAYAAHADEAEPGPASFIAKAGTLLDGLEVEIEWMDGSRQVRTFGESPDPFDVRHEPRVRYLSQQFVERLCSPGALGEPLVEEIERVVFSAIPEEDRLECADFDELRRVSVEDHLAEQSVQRETIRSRTKAIAEEYALHRSLPALKARLQAFERDRIAIEKELVAVPLKVDEAKLAAQQAAATRVHELKMAIATAERRAQELHDLRAELQRQVRSANEQATSLRARYTDLLDDAVWRMLVVALPDAALPTLERLERDARASAASLRQHGRVPSAVIAVSDQAAASAPSGLATLETELARVTKELGLDQTKVARRAELDKRLLAARQAEERAGRERARAEKAALHMKEAKEVRLAAYQQVFEALVAEEAKLLELYSPLRRRIEQDPRLAKLSFKVHRVVDIDTWANRGESLLDLRRPPFQRRGQLADVARVALLDVWRRGTPLEVRAAMEAFVENNGGAAVEALAQGVTPLDFGEWLFSTTHVNVRYGIQYENVDVAHLSPGTRGIVLLALYLGLDEWDLRPLIIDQPEENLDPRSVYTDLTPYFRDAARRRQVIMVTHNANLVVNTDSDQVIVAEAERSSPTELPRVHYIAGGLEEADIRTHVCRLLEGGADAFKKRGERYGVVRGRS
jgi:hypothetical protein